MMKRFLLSLMLLVMSSAASAAEEVRLAVLDVGEGQAVLLHRGRHGLLIDTGHFGRQLEIASALRRYGVEEVEGVILTHLHADHASGIFAIMRDFPQAVVYESGHRPAYDGCLDGSRWVADKLDSGDWTVRRLRQGMILRWRKAEIAVLWPGRDMAADMNASSLVLSLTLAGEPVLIMGDAGLEQERRLLEQGLLPRRVAVLVVGHHGAADATSEALLQWARPRHAVVSVDDGNRRGYPAAEVLRRISSSGAALHLTSRGGDFLWTPSAGAPE